MNTANSSSVTLIRPSVNSTPGLPGSELPAFGANQASAIFKPIMQATAHEHSKLPPQPCFVVAKDAALQSLPGGAGY